MQDFLIASLELSHLEVWKWDRVGDPKTPPIGNVARCFGLMQAPLQILLAEKVWNGWAGVQGAPQSSSCKVGSLRGVNYGELAMLKCCKEIYGYYYYCYVGCEKRGGEEDINNDVHI